MAVHPFSVPGTAGLPPALSFNEGKGHLSVNPVCGCSLGCPYCLNLADGIGSTRRALAPVSALVETLARHRATVRQVHLSVLDLCDPFEPSVLPVLRELMEGLQLRLPGQAVVVTSRLHPGPRWLDWLTSLSLKVSVFVSLGDATGRVPPVTSVPRRLELLEDCRDRGLHSVMLLRPLAREWTQPKVLRSLLERAQSCCDEVVMSGLVLSEHVEASLRQSGWPVPTLTAGETGALPADFRAELREMATGIVGRIPVSEHRSCAVNRHLRLPCLVTQTPDPRTPGAPLVVVACCGPDFTCGAPVRVDGYCRLKEAA